MMTDSIITPRPVLKWAGGKTQLLPDLLRKMPKNFNGYHEPFVGGGALYFALNRPGSTISDLNPKLVNLYRTLRDNFENLWQELQKIEDHYNQLAIDEQKHYFYESRNRFNNSEITQLESAALFVLLNKAGFNGLYRENSRGLFNVPFGQRLKISLGEKSNFKSASELLRTSSINHNSFEAVVDNALPGDLVYFDPPYVPLEGSPSFTSYLSSGFGPDEQTSLANVFEELDRNGVLVMLSNSNTPTVRNLYSKHNVDVVEAKRNINSVGDARGKVEEVIVTNF